MSRLLSILFVCMLPLAATGALPNAGEAAGEILATSGVQGGLVVHVGCGDGELTADLCASGSYMVHGLDRDPENVALARERLREHGVYGAVTIDRLTDAKLPYIDNLVNLLVAEKSAGIAEAEILRVLCPEGVACIREGGRWTKLVKPRPEAIDEWGHYLHDASNNAVSRDTVVGPPRRLQWVGGPRYSRHHDRMSSVSAVVSSGGRVFSIFDEATPASILAPPKWSLIARDAFNGTVLWKRGIEKWHTHLWPLKSGPAQLPRRLVASGDRVYVTLRLDGPLLALDAATGETVRTYEGTAATEEILLDDGVLVLRVNAGASAPEYDGLRGIHKAVREPFYDEEPRQIVALEAESGKVLWAVREGVLPGTLAIGSGGVFFHDGRSVVALDRKTGAERWRSETVDRQRNLRSLYMPTLVVYGDVVLFSGKGGPPSGNSRSGARGDQLVALSARDGEILWHADHPSSGYKSPEDVLVAGGLVWCGETTGGSGVFTGRDPRTGEVKSEFPPDTDVFWFHHRCYRGKATEKYLLMSRTGIEFVDFRKQQWLANHWVRGACLYGVMPANGFIYAPQHPCACYLETKLSGFNALAPASAGPRIPAELADQPRLERGPAYDAVSEVGHEKAQEDDWPTYRADAQRSGRARSVVGPEVACRWSAELGGELTSPVIAGGRVFVASRSTHTVHALDASEGRSLWSFTAGGQVDSPPTIHEGRVLFGSADGYVYCLRAADGALAWRFLAAPIDQRLMAFGQLQSVWPVHGSVLVRDGEAWAVAGRSVFLDGGLRLWRLDPASGSVLSKTVLDNVDPATGEDLHAYVSWLNMPAGLPDILSSDGRHVYMRSRAFEMDGTPLPPEKFPRTGEGHGGRSFAPPPNQDEQFAHLFSPTGFLDDSGWHRSYWLYGSRFYSGWSAYYLSGKVVPAGQILVFDDSHVYGFGRKPQYFRWTTPKENHLFCAGKQMPPPMSKLPGKAVRTGKAADELLSRVLVPNSESLDPSEKSLTVAAWVKADRADGAVLAHGGNSQGYVLFLQKGRPHFAVRGNGSVETVAAEEDAAGRWCHVAGVLTAGKKLELYVDGKLAASSRSEVLVPNQPMESIDIGADGRTPVVDSLDSGQFQGQIDELCVYHRALSATEVDGLAAGRGVTDADQTRLVMAFSFDDSKATDASGQGNHGTLQNAKLADGKVGRALAVSAEKIESAKGPLVSHRWTRDLPLMARAMVLAGDVLFVAGPPDLVDEDEAARSLADPAVQAKLAEHGAALEGEKGGLLQAVDLSDGRRLAEQPLDAPPVFDGMAAAAGRLFLVTTDGKVLCFGR